MHERLLTFDGRTQTRAAWAVELGITPDALKARLRRMPFEKAMTMQRDGARPRTIRGTMRMTRLIERLNAR